MSTYLFYVSGFKFRQVKLPWHHCQWQLTLPQSTGLSRLRQCWRHHKLQPKLKPVA